MPLRVSNLRLPIDVDEAELGARLAAALHLRPADLGHWRILRKSLDAREATDLAFVYSLEVTPPGDEGALLQAAQRRGGRLKIETWFEEPFALPSPGTQPLPHRPVIVGSGPGGLAAAYFLALAGYRPLVLERGSPVSQRIREVAAFDAGGPHNPESNYLFGEGGAGTFSDGKLTYRSSGPEVRRILEMYAECKGKPSILYDQRPHLGSNRLPAVVKAQRQAIEALGGEFRFHCRLEDLDLKDGRLHGIGTSSGFLPAEVVVLAIGHSARDTFKMLHRRGVPLEQKAFQMGVRIEQPQEQVNRHCYGKAHLEERLGAANYSVVAKTRGPDLFSFCMCAGGYVMPSVSTPGEFCTNGMSLSKHDSPFANSGLVVTVEPRQFGSGDVLAGVRFQQRYERLAYELGRGDYACPIQWASDYLAGKKSTGQLPTSYPRGTVNVDLRGCLPDFIATAVEQALPIVDRKWQGRFLKHATLVGPESRGSSPVRMPRDEASRESLGLAGLYPVGEGAGYAGGIVSAAVDGLRTALAIIQRFAPVEK